LGTLLLVSGFFAPANFTWGILAGGLLSIMNFYGLCRGLQSAFGKWEANQRLNKTPFLLKYLMRMAVTVVFLYVILVKTAANIFGVVIGLATVILGIILTVVLALFDKSYIEEV